MFVFVVLDASGLAQRFHITTGNRLHQTKFNNVQVLTATYNNDGSHSLFGFSNAKIVMVDEETNTTKMIFEAR